jgi:hypothetical protein
MTRAQVWKCLVLKASDAHLFLPPNLCTRCDVVELSATHIEREATIAGDDLREIIAFEPEKKVTFLQATSPREGAIVNELFERRGGRAAIEILLLHRLAGQEALRPRRAGRADAVRQRQGL